MAQNRCSADEAFQILRGASQNRDVKLRDLAAALVGGIAGTAPAEPARRGSAPEAGRTEPSAPTRPTATERP